MNDSNINPMNNDQADYEPKLTNPSQTDETRRAILRTAGVLGLVSIGPGLVMATSPLPKNPPKTLEQRIEDASYILIGVFNKFLHVPESAYKKFSDARDIDPAYIRLETEKASFEAYRAYYRSRPGDKIEFRLREEYEEIEGAATTFLECDILKIAFRRKETVAEKIATSGTRIYFQIGGDLRLRNPNPNRIESRNAWQSYFGKKVILLSVGYRPQRDSIELPFPVLGLTFGNHRLDQYPVPLSELPAVTEVANRLGFVHADKS